MKIAITGKGGVGKTTLAATLARLYASEGRKVLAADVDPDANLGMALGFTPEEVEGLTPISEMSALIAERTGSKSDGLGKLFRLNPQVDDIPDRFAIEKNGVKLLVLGTVEVGGHGCVCPEHVVLKQVLSNLVVHRKDVVILDMEAGLEHLGRGTTSFVDCFVVVVEPGARSIQTYEKVKKLAADLGVKKVRVAASKIKNEEDIEFIKARIPEEDILGFVSYSEQIIAADRAGLSPFDVSESAVSDIGKIKSRIDNEIEGEASN